MNQAEAAELLRLHSLSPPESDDPKVGSGFVGSLHTWKGFPPDNNFHEIMGALRVIAPDLKAQMIRREVVRSVFRIVDYAQLQLDMYFEGFNRSRYKESEVATLARWRSQISFTFAMLLDPESPLSEAFVGYDSPL